MQYVRWLDQLSLDDLATAGGKAASLGELTRAGMLVPPGFCLTTAAYQQRPDDGGASPYVRQELEAALAELRVRAASVGLEGVRFAVRSSATAEDLADASFAGIYKTFLGLSTDSEVAEAVEACWRSASSPEALTYLQERFEGATAEMAVVVQALVPSEAAGVMFTAHPVTAELDKAVVNASWGLGESVVASLVTGDTWTLAKEPFAVLERHVGDKPTQITGEGSVQVGERLRLVRSLDDSQLRQLAEVALKLERHYAFPQDVEFAFAADRLYVLQSRRISTLQEDYYTAELHRWARDIGLSSDPDTLWARGTPLSALPVSPLYFSEMSKFFTDMFGELARLKGVEPAKRQDFRYYRGWSYINTAFGSEMQPQTPGLLRFRRWWPEARLQATHPRTLSIWFAADHYYSQRDDVWLPEIERRRPDLATASPEQVIDFIEFIEKQRRERSIIAATAVGHGGTLISWLTTALKRWADDPEASLLADLTSGLPGSETHDENVGVWRLAQEAAASSDVSAAVSDGRFDELDRSEAGRHFLKSVQEFAAARPHRGTSDRDILQPRWGDDPEMLLAQVRVFVRGAFVEDPQTAHARAAERRREATRRAEDAIGRGALGPARLVAFRRLLALTQKYWVYRDNQRHSFDHYFYNLRCAYRALGARLVGRGVLPEADDVFFLSKEEICDLFAGKLPRREGRQRAAWRKRAWPKWSAEEPPPLLRGDEAVETGAPGAAPDGALQGVGGSSGRVTGTARVVPNISGLVDVAAGEILVTHAIDPAWTPVFSLLGGVVSEEGGMLSHATVLAREYGVPAVIGLQGATRLIKSGQRVTIDGLRGTVIIEAPESDPLKESR
jgi:pyruvate,water dikinase